MEFQINRLKTFYLLPGTTRPLKKCMLSRAGFFMDHFKLNAMCYYCNGGSDINRSVVSIMDEHMLCSTSHNKRNHNIQSPYPFDKVTFPSNPLFEEFRIATFEYCELNANHKPLVEKLSHDGFYFFQKPMTIKCAYCKLVLANPMIFNLKNHSRSQTCSMKKQIMTDAIEKLDFDYFEKTCEIAIKTPSNQKTTLFTSKTEKYRVVRTEFEAGTSNSKKELKRLSMPIFVRQSPDKRTTRINTFTSRDYRSLNTAFRDSTAVRVPIPSQIFNDILEISNNSIKGGSDSWVQMNSQNRNKNEIAVAINEKSLKKYLQDRRRTSDASYGNSSFNFDTEDKIHEETDTEFNCKICFDEKVCILFTPCHHIVTCKVCSLFLIKCPKCNEKILSKYRVYF